MPEHIQYEDDDLFNPETHHEESDVPVAGLLWAILIFVVLSAVSHFVILGFYNYLVRAEHARMDPPRSAVARPANADVPQNQPLLQPFPTVDGKGTAIPPQSNTPVTDLVHMREVEKQRLTTYGWVDKERGLVHMPIQTAKELLAAKLAVEGQLGGTPAVAPVVVPPPPAAEAAAAPQETHQ